jgi:hypothetical protein
METPIKGFETDLGKLPSLEITNPTQPCHTEVMLMIVTTAFLPSLPISI